MGADATAYYIQDSADTDSALSISTTRVGIGTASPDRQLEISHGAAAHTPVLRLTGTDVNAYAAEMEWYSGAGGGKITSQMGSTASSSQGGVWWLEVRDQTSNDLVRRMHIDKDGKCGIGTASPGVKLEVQDSVNGGDVAVRIRNNETASSDETATLQFMHGSRLGSTIVGGRESTFEGAGSADGFLAFYTSLDGTNAEQMRITSGGNVGIGTASPSQKLDITAGHILLDNGYGLYFGDTNCGINGRTDTDKIEFATSNSVKMTIDSSGNVGIGKTPDGSVGTTGVEFIGSGGDKGRMILSGDTAALIGRNLTGSTSQPVINWYRQTTLVGSVSVTDTSTAYNTSSDYRLKENEVLITDGLERLNQLKPYRFNFKVNPDNIVDGFFAHEVSSIVPESISGEKDAMIDEEVSPAIEAVEAVEAQDAVYETVTLQRQVVVVSEVEEEVSSTEIVLEDGKYVQKTTTEMVTKEVSEPQWEDVPLYGEDGEQLMRLVSEAIEAKEAVLDEDGNETEEAVDAQDAVYEGITHRIPEMEEYDEEQLVSESVEAVEAVEGQDAVSESVPDYQGIDQAKLVPLLVAAIQELSAKVEALESK